MGRWNEFINEFNKVRGRLNITEPEIFLILYHAFKRGSISRYFISDKLKIGDSTARGVLKRLCKLGYMHPIRSGHKLTSKGIELIRYYAERIDIFDSIDIPIKVDKVNIIFIARRASEGVSRGIEERDNVVKFSGSGAITMICKDGKIYFPDSGEEIDNWYPKLSKRLIEDLNVEDNDVIIVSGASEYSSALKGGIYAVLKLLERCLE